MFPRYFSGEHGLKLFQKSVFLNNFFIIWGEPFWIARWGYLQSFPIFLSTCIFPTPGPWLKILSSKLLKIWSISAGPRLHPPGLAAEGTARGRLEKFNHRKTAHRSPLLRRKFKPPSPSRFKNPILASDFSLYLPLRKKVSFYSLFTFHLKPWKPWQINNHILPKSHSPSTTIRLAIFSIYYRDSGPRSRF